MTSRTTNCCLALLAILFLALLVGFTTTADQNDLYFSGSEHHEQTTSGITTTGAGPTLNTALHPHSMLSMVVDRTAGSTNAVQINIELSLDCIDWIQVGGSGDGFGDVAVTFLGFEPEDAHVHGFPFQCARYNIQTIGAGNTLQIHLLTMR